MLKMQKKKKKKKMQTVTNVSLMLSVGDGICSVLFFDR